MSEIFSNLFTAIIAGTAVALINEMFNRKRDAKKEKKEKEENRYKINRENLASVYKGLYESIRRLPNKAPKDILARVADTSEYKSFKSDEVHSILSKLLREAIKKGDEGISEKKKIEKCLNDLAYFYASDYEFTYWFNFGVLDNSSFTLYASDDVKRATKDLRELVEDALIFGKTGFIEDQRFSKSNDKLIKINKFDFASKKLFEYMKKDLGLLEK